jgi:hypothetical protein
MILAGHSLSKGYAPCGLRPPTSISYFRDKLLASIFMKVVRKMTYINGYDLIRAFASYASKRCFHAAKLVVTFDVSDLEGIDAIFTAKFTSWSNGSSRIRHQLSCSLRQISSPDPQHEINDQVLITAHGVRSLNKLSRESILSTGFVLTRPISSFATT